jgi:hypothetical protein
MKETMAVVTYDVNPEIAACLDVLGWPDKAYNDDSHKRFLFVY